MSICVIIDQFNNLTATTTSLADCTAYVLLDKADYSTIIMPIDLALLGVTPEAILYTFTWGMGAILSIWAIGYAIGAAKKSINKT